MKRLGVVLAILFACGAAHAQAAGGEAEAQELFDEGRRLAQSGNHKDACPKFATSDQLAPSGGALLNLADCYEKIGRTASAWVKFRAVAERADAANRPEVAKMARERAEALLPRIPKLTVKIVERAEGLAVTRDGEPLPEAEWGAELPIDPGAHAIAATASDREPWSRNVTLAEGQHVTVLVGPLPKHEQDAQATAATSPFPYRTTGLIVGGVGVVGLGVGTAFGLVAMSKRSDVESACPGGVCPNAATRDSKQSVNDSAKSSALISTVTIGAGVVCLGAGIALYLLAPHEGREERRAGLRVVPSASPGGASLAAVGTF